MRYLISDYKICDFGYEQSDVKGCFVMLYVLVVMRYVGNDYEQSCVNGWGYAICINGYEL